MKTIKLHQSDIEKSLQSIKTNSTSEIYFTHEGHILPSRNINDTLILMNSKYYCPYSGSLLFPRLLFVKACNFYKTWLKEGIINTITLRNLQLELNEACYDDGLDHLYYITVESNLMGIICQNMEQTL